MALGGHLLDECAHTGAAGEADVVNARVAGQRVAHFVAVTGDDVDGPRWKTHLGGQLRHTDQAQARVFGGLDHAGIACSQSAAHAAPKNLHRVVPGDHMARHTVWLSPGQHAVAVLVGQGLAVQLVAGAGIKLKVARQSHGVGGCLFGGFAAVALLQRSQLGGVLIHFLRQLHEQATTLHGAQLAPSAVEGGSRRHHSGIDVGRLAARDLIEHLPVRRVEHVDGLTCQGGGGLVGDEIHLHGAIVSPGRILKITHGTSTFADQPSKKRPAKAGLSNRRTHQPP